MLGASGGNGLDPASVLGGEFCNLQVEFEAVVDPEDEDDCNEEDEICESRFCDVSLRTGLVLCRAITFASASCIRHNAPELRPPPSCVASSVLFKVDFSLPLSLLMLIRLLVLEGHLDE